MVTTRNLDIPGDLENSQKAQGAQYTDAKRGVRLYKG